MFHDPNDPILPSIAAESIFQVCSNGYQITHAKKHSIPIQKEYLDAVCSFLQNPEQFLANK